MLLQINNYTNAATYALPFLRNSSIFISPRRFASSAEASRLAEESEVSTASLKRFESIENALSAVVWNLRPPPLSQSAVDSSSPSFQISDKPTLSSTSGGFAGAESAAPLSGSFAPSALVSAFASVVEASEVFDASLNFSLRD